MEFDSNSARDISFKGLFSDSCPCWLMQIASRLGIRVQDVKNVIIWGNHSSTQYPDVNHGTVPSADGSAVPIRQAVKDDNWLNGDFVRVRHCSATCSIVSRLVVILVLSGYVFSSFLSHTVVFTWISKVISIRFGSVLLCCMRIL